MHDYWNGGWHHMAWMGWWWWCAIILVAVALIFALNNNGRRSDAGDSPEQILKRRYAGGEITREEYDRKLEELRR